MKDEEEEELLKNVTLQGARSIYLARKRAEEELLRAKDALAKQSELLRVTLTSIGDAVITTDTSGRVQSLNPVAEELTGWPQSEAVGRPLSEIFHIFNEDTRTPVENPAERALQEGHVVGLANHTILVSRSGVHTPIDDSAAPIRDEEGRVHGVVLIFRSVAERKLAENALRESEQELADFFENASVGMHWVGPDGNILRANRSELNLLGYSPDEYLGHHIAEFHVDQNVIADILRRLAAGEILRDYEAQMRCRDGSIKDVLIDSSVLWRDGQFVHTRCVTRDVTDRKRADEAQARLAAIVESSQDAIVSKTLEGQIISWNTAAERLFGYSSAEAVGQPITMLIPAERQDEEQTILSRLRRGERIEHYETVRISKEGRRMELSLTISPVRDGKGRIIGASKIARDITTKKRAEELLRESEARFRQLADAMPQIVWAARADGFIDYYNERWYEFTGFSKTPEPNNDHSWVPILHPNDVQRTKDTYYSCIKSGTEYEIEYRFRDRKTGGYRWFLGRAYPVRDEHGRISRWLGTCTDIDDTKRSEESSRFQAQASAALAELTDTESTLQKVAALAVPHFADWCTVDMVQRDGSLRRLAAAHANSDKMDFVRELERKFPSRASETRGVRQVIRTGQTEWAASIPEEVFVELSQGEEEHLRIIRELGLKSYISVPMKSRHRVFGAITFVTAESGRVYDLNDVRVAEDLAQRAVIAIENANLVSALKESDRRKDEFLAILAHELRNPLAPMRNAVQILRAKGPVVPELQWAREMIDRQINQMTRLVDDLLDVSRITRGRIELRKERVELRAVVNDAVEASRPLMEKRRHTVSVEFPPEPIMLDADPTRLTQVLLNLLNNAAKYMDEGGRIWLTAKRESERVAISVKDTGVGIPPEMLPQIFEMFTQVDRSNERSQGGLGIGLTLVERLVALHGGKVEALSAGPGKGSEFIVRLPVVTQASRTKPRPVQEKPNVVTVERRILVVDDNQDSAESMAMFLRILGHEVRTAHDGLAAIEVAEEFQPHVILLDVGLPGLNGYKVAQHIRERRGADVVLIALTGWGQDEDRRRSKEAGLDYHLTKPIEFDHLTKLLAELHLHEPPHGERRSAG
jgi:PAS domain S-box-containing protein